MRSIDEYRQILRLWEQGENKSKIARLTGIPRRTVFECIQRYGSLETLEKILEHKLPRGSAQTGSIVDWLQSCPPDVHQAYTYLLGLYLGDGNISKARGHRVFRLRLSLDQKYPRIIDEACCALCTILPDHRVGVVPQPGCVQVSCYYAHWPALLPQHGDGPKHTRRIMLTDWQQAIVVRYPLALLRGLYHSDGSRSQNIVSGKNYPRYLFANESPGIRRIYCQTCDQLGLHWTIANRRNVCISRRADVAVLDQMLGPKI